MKQFLPGNTIGILGCGQLGRMIATSAAMMGYKTIAYGPKKDGEIAPCEQVCSDVIYAEYDDKDRLREFASQCNLITFEFENIPSETVKFLESITTVRPGHEAIHNTQHRLRERNFLKDSGFPTHRFWHVKSAEDIVKAFKQDMKKGVLKTAYFGYDGKGQKIVNTEAEAEEVWKELKFNEAVLEEFVPFIKEISVVLARGFNKEIEIFPIGENLHSNGILSKSEIPANIDEKTKNRAIEVAKGIAEKLKYIGVMAVEFFVLPNGDVFVNEIAPRVHNSGHWTLDGCTVSQFEQHVRAICGLPLASARLLSPSIMENIIGDDIKKIPDYLQNRNANIYLYGKTKVKAGRKLGHVNIISSVNG